jgi:hypothetical protein
LFYLIEEVIGEPTAGVCSIPDISSSVATSELFRADEFDFEHPMQTSILLSAAFRSLMIVQFPIGPTNGLLLTAILLFMAD